MIIFSLAQIGRSFWVTHASSRDVRLHVQLALLLPTGRQITSQFLSPFLHPLTPKICRACQDKAKSAAHSHSGICSGTNSQQRRKAAYNSCVPSQEPASSCSSGSLLHGLVLKNLIKCSTTNYLTEHLERGGWGSKVPGTVYFTSPFEVCQGA